MCQCCLCPKCVLELTSLCLLSHKCRYITTVNKWMTSYLAYVDTYLLPRWVGVRGNLIMGEGVQLDVCSASILRFWLEITLVRLGRAQTQP